MYKPLWVIVIALMFGCGGCWNLVEVNNTALVAGLGADYLDNEQIEFTIQVLQPGAPEESGPVQQKSMVLSASGQTVTEAARRITLYLPRTPLWAHASSMIIGENLASHDLALIADFLFRNRHVREDTALLIAKDSGPKEIFALNDPVIGCSARCLDQLLRLQEWQHGTYVPVTLADFLLKLATPGVDPVLPMVRKTQVAGQKTFGLYEMAVFKERRMAGILNQVESQGYRWLNPGRAMGGVLVIDSPAGNGEKVVFEVVNFKHKQIPRFKNEKIEIDIEVEVALNFYEQQGTMPLVGLKQKPQLEAEAARQIRQEIRSCIEKAQNLNSDILGWGQCIHRNYPEDWKILESDWYEVYPAVKSNIQVKCRVDRTYLTTKSFQFR